YIRSEKKALTIKRLLSHNGLKIRWRWPIGRPLGAFDGASAGVRSRKRIVSRASAGRARWGRGTNPRVRARRQAMPTSAANTFWAPPYRYHLSSVTTHTTLFFQPPSRGFSYEVSMADTEIKEDSLDREGPGSNRQSTSDLLEAPKQRP